MKIIEKFLLTSLLAWFFIAAYSSPVRSKSNHDSSEVKSASKAVDKDVEVEQLESLKQQIVDEEDLINGGDKSEKQTAAQSPLAKNSNIEESEENKKNKGKKLLSDLKKGIDKKSEIHHQLENMRHVTPEDLALYIAKTGDEDGVSLIIQEMIAEHVMTTDDAVDFLAKIRENLRYLKEQNLQQQQMESNSLYQMKRTLPSLPSLGVLGSAVQMDPDYESILEKSLTKEAPSMQESYEEILYQMAKMIFIQAAEGEGDLGTEQALREISLILSKEVERGMISQEMQKRVIELIVSALTDTLATTDADPSFGSADDYFLQEPRGELPTSGLPSEKIPSLLHSPLFSKMDNTHFNNHFLLPLTSLKSKRDTLKA